MKKYSMEELMPFLIELTGQYTSKESTSVSYDKARQLMGAVLYFMNEAGRERPKRAETVDDSAFQSPQVLAGERIPGELYERGKLLVVERVREAGEIYGIILPVFDSYGVCCYQETMIDGIPAFFQKYDARYNPQDHILTLDYPVLGSVGSLKGIDVIFAYLQRVYLEQQFLNRFPRELVIKSLEDFYGDYEELFVNPCQVLMRKMVCHLIAEEVCPEDKLTELLLGDKDKLRRKVTKHISLMVLKLWKDDRRMTERLTGYLLADVPDFCIELRNAAEQDNLQLFFPV